MSVHFTQVTIGAANTALSATRTPCYQVIVQNNQTHDMRVGDSTISSSKGILLSQSGDTGVGRIGSVTFGPFPALNIELSQIFVNGTQNDVVDVIFIK